MQPTSGVKTNIRCILKQASTCRKHITRLKRQHTKIMQGYTAKSDRQSWPVLKCQGTSAILLQAKVHRLQELESSRLSLVGGTLLILLTYSSTSASRQVQHTSMACSMKLGNVPLPQLPSCASHPGQPAPALPWLCVPLLCYCDTQPPVMQCDNIMLCQTHAAQRVMSGSRSLQQQKQKLV